MRYLMNKSNSQNKYHFDNSKIHSSETATNDYLPKSVYENKENSEDNRYKRFTSDNVATNFRKKLP